MSDTITTFDVTQHHIHVEFFVTDAKGVRRSFDGILDTGAPRTEFNDVFLAYAGFIPASGTASPLRTDLQTQKYGRIIIPSIEICGRIIEKFEVMISRFEKSWGVAALIGLDFFRRFNVAIDYKAGHIVTRPFDIGIGNW